MRPAQWQCGSLAVRSPNRTAKPRGEPRRPRLVAFNYFPAFAKALSSFDPPSLGMFGVACSSGCAACCPTPHYLPATDRRRSLGRRGCVGGRLDGHNGQGLEHSNPRVSRHADRPHARCVLGGAAVTGHRGLRWWGRRGEGLELEQLHVHRNPP